MYGDIIPPKRKIHTTRTEEYNSVRFSAPHISYTEQKSKKVPIVLFMAALVVIGLVLYQNIYHSTKITLTPKTTHFEIKQKIPLILQGREKDSLTYSLVYVPATDASSTRNPFVATSTNTTTSKQAVFSITATSTGATKHIRIINKTADTVPLRKDTRFDVGGVTYTLDSATQNPPSSKDDIAQASSSVVYKVIGFKGYPTYETVYAVPEESTATSQTTSLSDSVSAIPPQDLLSLMPAGTLALQKSTIYDKLLEQSAVVVFDQASFEDFLKNTISQTAAYYKALKPFGESVTYDVRISDYTLETSEDTGKPVAFSSLTLDITPQIDSEHAKMQFAGFSKDTMNTVEKQVHEYVVLHTAYKPFWSDTVASADKIQVQVLEQ